LEEKNLPDDQPSKRVEAKETAEDIETLKQTLADEKAKAEEYLANWQRAQADFTNYKRRAEQEKSGVTDFANAMFVRDLLTILDDLERAFVSVPRQLMGLTWVDGVRLIHRKFQAILETQGLSEIEAEGQPFDPALHEAVMYGEGEEGIVIDEVQKGYKFKNRVIRPSLVVVGKRKGEKEAEAEQPGKEDEAAK